MHARTSTDRWTALATLLSNLERAAEWSARLDAYNTPQLRGRPKTHAQILTFGAWLTTLDHRIDHQIDLLTAELLTEQLARKRFVEHGEMPPPEAAVREDMELPIVSIREDSASSSSVPAQII